LISSLATFLKRQEILEWFGGREGFVNLHQGLVQGKVLGQFTSGDPD